MQIKQQLNRKAIVMCKVVKEVVVTALLALTALSVSIMVVSGLYNVLKSFYKHLGL